MLGFRGPRTQPFGLFQPQGDQPLLELSVLLLHFLLDAKSRALLDQRVLLLADLALLGTVTFLLGH